LGLWAPPAWFGGRINGLAGAALFVIIGLKHFKVPL
jgi:hypothetical protein